MSTADREAMQGGTFVVYEWNAWTDFLITKVVPAAVRACASPGRDAARALASLPADTATFLFHIDCTRTHRFPRDRPHLVAGLASRGVRMLNDALTDISKRHLQRTCARLGLATVATTRQGDPRDMLIVKTDLNSAGVRERYLTRWQRWRMDVRLSDTILGRDDYKVLARADVPSSWWEDDTLAIERYVANAGNVWYRAYLFLDRLVVSRARSDRGVKRMYYANERTNAAFVIGATGVEPVAASHPIPSAVLQAIATLARGTGLAFGTLDIAVDDEGQAYVVDLNVTPFCRDGSDDIVCHLRGAADTASARTHAT